MKALEPIRRTDAATAVKVKSYRIRQNGERGLALTLPRVWIDDLGLRAGDRLDVYRDTQDRLIIQAARPEQREELPFGAGQEARR